MILATQTACLCMPLLRCTLSKLLHGVFVCLFACLLFSVGEEDEVSISEVAHMIAEAMNFSEKLVVRECLRKVRHLYFVVGFRGLHVRM